jgi:ribonucleoside-diphosphate reductase alpha chain
MAIFIKEWLSLYQSKAGERGIFNRVAAKNSSPERREHSEFGTNPCGEITLRSGQFCNLTEAVIRPDDDEDDIAEKIELAAILGTLQAGLTNFRYLRPKWRKNTEEEALLGVSLTGIMDNDLTAGEQGLEWLSAFLDEWREWAVKVNDKTALEIGINPAAAVTCVKPSGTVSQLVGSASGIHQRYADHYIRRVRASKTDPICDALVKAGVPYEEDVTNPSQWVFEFPIKSPAGTRNRDSRSAIEMLELWLVYMEHWAEHQVSTTIYVREDEWLDVAAWVYKHFDRIAGLSFLPAEDGAHVYQQAPYEAISEEQYKALAATFPEVIDLHVAEEDDNTSGSQELACTAGSCEI